MGYVDGFLLTVAADRIDDYKAMAEMAGKIWMEHGARGFVETQADDDGMEGMRSFADAAGCKAGEVPIFSYILFDSREHRDAVNAKVMADPRMEEQMKNKEMPFDCARMAYGGFTPLVQL